MSADVYGGEIQCLPACVGMARVDAIQRPGSL